MTTYFWQNNSFQEGYEKLDESVKAMFRGEFETLMLMQYLNLADEIYFNKKLR